MALAARVLTHARTCVRILACVQTHNYPPHPRLTNTEYARQLTHSSPSHSLPSHVLTARPHPASDLTPVSPTQVHLPATSPACPRPLCHNRHLRGSSLRGLLASAFATAKSKDVTIAVLYGCTACLRQLFFDLNEDTRLALHLLHHMRLRRQVT